MTVFSSTPSNSTNTLSARTDAPFVIAGKTYTSRLLVGTGKYASIELTSEAIRASGAQIVTLAIQRTASKAPEGQALLDCFPESEFTLLPNTAGCYTAEDAVRVARLGRELLDGHPLLKLEVLGDQKTLFPDVIQTLKAAKILVDEGFQIMVYTSDDPIVARQLCDLGCVAIMPLAAPIGSGLGIQNRYNIEFIMESVDVPVIVDAGVGTASDAVLAMELGIDAILMNTALAEAQDPVRMAVAMKHGVIAGRQAYLAGRMPRRRYASASSPIPEFI
ncbi:MAG: thiazole synthase [Pseudomonadota bacterium]